jgi:hypothetical protein
MLAPPPPRPLRETFLATAMVIGITMLRRCCPLPGYRGVVAGRAPDDVRQQHAVDSRELAANAGFSACGTLTLAPCDVSHICCTDSRLKI